ncbi:MAG: FAD-dependent oxidoreductase [Acidimicrobiia bacterium]
MAPSVLIIGAGMAGITSGRVLDAAGFDVLLIDKGRAVGGRMATRRIGEATFDHGAQHISVRTAGFAREMEALMRQGTADVWYRSESVRHPERGTENRYAGVGGMRRIPEALAEGLSVTTGVRVNRLSINTNGVTAIAGNAPVATADAVILTPPLPQTLELLAASDVTGGSEVDSLAGVEYDAILAVMASLDAPAMTVEGHRAFSSGPIGWMADNQQKGVSAVPALTIHSSPEFARTHLDSDPDRWMAELLVAARPFHQSSVVHAAAHRWRFAQPQATIDVGAVTIDAPAPVVLAGEVFAGARVEGAHTSGKAAAQLIMDRVG